MESYEFLIDERPLCIWDWDLREKNLRFLRGIDPRYFRHVAELNGSLLEDGKHHHAALSLRLAYSHALESFAALAGAAFQAPACPLGWLLQYTNPELYSVVEKITNGHGLPIRLKTAPTWEGLAQAVLAPANIDDALKPALRDSLAGLWVRFASDYLDKAQHDEYNSLKHGLRVTPGGFVLRMGVEPSYGVSPPEDEMQTIGASEYGSSFYIVERPVGGRVDFRPRNFSRNWHPENLFHGVDLLAMSMVNIVAMLNSVADGRPEDIRFERLQDVSGYDLPWQQDEGVKTFNMDATVSAVDIVASDPSSIERRLMP